MTLTADAFVDNLWRTGSRQAASGLSFVSAAQLDALDQSTGPELDALGFGVVKLDGRGTISVYNRYESELSGVQPSAAVGKNLFTDIAPCTNNRIFRGTFQRGVNEGAMNVLFYYTFTYRMSPTEVRVHLKSGRDGAYWVLIQKK